MVNEVRMTEQVVQLLKDTIEADYAINDSNAGLTMGIVRAETRTAAGFDFDINYTVFVRSQSLHIGVNHCYGDRVKIADTQIAFPVSGISAPLIKTATKGLIKDAERYAKFAMKYYKQEQENEKTKS